MMDILGRRQSKDMIAYTDKHSLVSEKPFLYMISLPNDHISTKVIEQNKVFVINFFKNKKNIEINEKFDPRFQDQFKSMAFEKAEAKTIDCCKILDADAFLECEVIETMHTGECTSFVGKVTMRS